MIVPPSGKVIGREEKRNMHMAVDEGWLTAGPWNATFEDRLAKFIGVRHVLTCNSGSSANLLAFSALTSSRLGDRRICSGDEVITVAAGFPTTINPVLQHNCVPVFCDITLPEYNIDVTQLSAALSSKTRAVILAHTLGQPFDITSVRKFCGDNSLWLIEDCCDALGATVGGQHVGTCADIATLSFYPAHHITTGEGGAVFTRSAKLASVAESLRDWGRSCFCPPGVDNTCKRRFAQQHSTLPFGYDHKYTYSELGYNLKLTDVQAACGVAQMDRLGGFISSRIDNYLYLRNGLFDLHAHLVFPPPDVTSPFGFPLTCRHPAVRDRLVAHLTEQGVGTRPLFGGNLIRQPYMQGRQFRTVGPLSVTDRVMRDSFWIGCWPGLTEAQLNWSITCIKEFFA